jgi:hypothetical protein
MRLLKISFDGTEESSKSSKQRVFMAHPSNGFTPFANSSSEGRLGLRNGRIPHRGQK